MSEPHTTRKTGLVIGIDASRAARSRRTGTEAYATYLIRELTPIAASRGHRLRLYFNQPPPSGLFVQASHVQLRTISFPRLWTHMRLAWELGRRPPDLFFTPAHVIPFTYRGPAIATVHDLGYHYFPEAHTRSQRSYLRWSTQHNARRSRVVIADSQATKDDLQTLYGVDAHKVCVVYPGIDPLLAPETDAAELARVQDKYGIRAPYFLYLGTLQPRKNLQRLIDAYVQSDVPAQLVLAGQAGWLSEPILQHVSSVLGKSEDVNKIHLAGYVEEDDKAALLSGALALLFPSLYEGFGFPILEAQRCRTPVLCGNNSSQPEVAGDAALLVEARDTASIAAGIQQLMADEELRRRLVRAGSENIARFNWRQAAKQVMDVLERAAS